MQDSQDQDKQVPTHAQSQFRQSVYSSIPEQFNWNIQAFSPSSALQNVSQFIQKHPQKQEQPEGQQIITIKIVEQIVKGIGPLKYTEFILNIEDRDGKYQIARKYKDFELIHEKLITRWPGCFVPSIPKRSSTTNNQSYAKNFRKKYLNNFLNRIAQNSIIYYQEQFQTFLKSDEDLVSKNLQQFGNLSIPKLLTKLATAFPEYLKAIQDSPMEQRFPGTYVSQILDQEFQLRQMKLQLSSFKNQFRKLAQLRQRYNQAEKMVFKKLLPQFQQACLDWYQNQFTGNLEGQVAQSKKYFSDEGIKEKIQLFQTQLWDTNPLWEYYDIFKLQLREIEAMISCIQQIQHVITEKNYLERNIANNKQQIQDLSEKKRTLKTFLMRGSEQQKKEALSEQIQKMEKKYQEVSELFYIVLLSMKQCFESFHRQQRKSYISHLVKVSKQQISLCLKKMEFYFAQYDHKIAFTE